MVKTTKYEEDKDWRTYKKKKSRVKKPNQITPPKKVEPVVSDDEDVPLNKIRNEIIKEKKTASYKNVCKICKKSFRESYHLKFHMRIHLTHKCSECNKEFKEIAHLKSHQKAHLTRIKCELCCEFFHPNGIKYHIQTAHEKVLECLSCDTQFSSSKDLKNHMKRHRRQETPRSVCEICEKSFSEKSKMVVHRRIHTGELPYTCALCSERFHSKSYINAHMRTIHLVNLYACDQCDFKAKKLANLKLHIRKTHTGEMPYECETCLQCFFSAEDLKKHITKEHEHMVTMNKCETCNKTFSRPDHLKRHLQTVHSAENKPKQYKCDQCDACFGYANQLRTHAAIHNGTKFACRKCGRAFGTHLNHSRHERACCKSGTNEEGAYKCDICPLSFKSAKERAKHNCFEMDNSGSDDSENEFEDYEPFIEDEYVNGIPKNIQKVQVVLKDIKDVSTTKNEEEIVVKKEIVDLDEIKEEMAVLNEENVIENNEPGEKEEISALEEENFPDNDEKPKISEKPPEEKLVHSDRPHRNQKNIIIPQEKPVCNDKPHRTPKNQNKIMFIQPEDEVAKSSLIEKGHESDDEEQQFPCEVCKKPFRYLNSMIQHSRVHLINCRKRVP